MSLSAPAPSGNQASACNVGAVTRRHVTVGSDFQNLPLSLTNSGQNVLREAAAPETQARTQEACTNPSIHADAASDDVPVCP